MNKSSSQTPAAVASGDLRQHQRTDCTTQIRYRIKKVVGQFSGQLVGDGTVINVSEGGVMIQCPHKLGRGSVIEINVAEDARLQTRTLRIIRADKSQLDYEIAAEFM